MKTILITGAGSGIGRDAAAALAAKGHKVIATMETDELGMSLKVYAKERGLNWEISRNILALVKVWI